MIYLVTSLLLLSCLSSYADEETATYYTFVMYKAPNESQWELPSYPIKDGSYRFQIVYMNPHEENNLQWIALRGEFEFEPDNVGVKIKNKYTLDINTAEAFNNITNKDVSLWSRNSWKENGPKWVQPLIVQMNKLRKDAGKAGGTQNPNFIRFLIKEKKLEDNWTYNGKQYHIYRIHYFDNNQADNQIEIISRFINPKQSPTTDIKELKKWVDDNKDFKLAEYLGEPDERHANFYKYFQQFFNQWYNKINESNFSTIAPKKKTDSNWVSILLAILFVLIIAIISIAVYFQKELKLLIKSKKTDYGLDDDGFSHKNTEPAAYLKRDEENKESAFDNVSINEFNKLKKELQQQINQLEKVQNDLQISSSHTQATPEIDNNQLSQLVEMAVKKYLDKNLGNYLNLHLKDYKNQTTQPKDNQPPTQTLPDKRNEKQAYTPPPATTPKQPEKPTDNTITQIKTLLLSNKSVDDEVALNSLDTNVDPCTFITSVVASYLKLNQPLTHYQRLNDAIKNLTNNKISLLIPNVGEDVNTVEHNVVGQQTVTKGKLNVVASFSRPGVKCDGVIKRKAEVVQNV